jgi:hypothetical protein
VSMPPGSVRSGRTAGGAAPAGEDGCRRDACGRSSGRSAPIGGPTRARLP